MNILTIIGLGVHGSLEQLELADQRVIEEKEVEGGGGTGALIG